MNSDTYDMAETSLLSHWHYVCFLQLPAVLISYPSFMYPRASVIACYQDLPICFCMAFTLCLPSCFFCQWCISIAIFRMRLYPEF